MQGRLRYGYLHLADSIHAIVSPVGCAWREVRLGDSTIELYSDVVHPSIAGTYLAANVFYTTLFQQSPIGNSFMAGLDPVIAHFLQQKASGLVLDSLDVWNILPSGITTQDNGTLTDWRAWYNADQGKILLSWEGMKPGNYSASFYNVTGQKIFDNIISVANASGNTIVSCPKIKSGIYLIKLSGHKYSKAIRFFSL